MARTWTKSDAEAYKENIHKTLKDFGVYNEMLGNE